MEIERILLVIFLVPLILGFWCFVFYLIDDTFFNGLFVEKVRMWSREKFEKRADDGKTVRKII